MAIYRENNKIVFKGAFSLQDLHKPLAGIHQAITNAGYSDIILDFSECEAAYQPPMLGICTQIASLRRSHIDTSIKLPLQEELKRLFINANWAHILSPKTYDPSSFKGYTQVPATAYTTPEEQTQAVDKIVNAILTAIPDLERRDFAALEWAVNELTDNVLVHSQSNVGGFIQVSSFKKNTKKIAFMVADAGVGIPKTLREGHPEITSDVDALDKAIREGVTRDNSVGQGNGLYGSYKICSNSNGFFQLDSGHAKLRFTAQQGLTVSTERVPYDGTLVVAEIDFSVPHLLEEALQFGGKKHSPVDYVETHYEDPNSDRIIFKVAEESRSFGSRVAGTPLRQKLNNLATMCPGQQINIDFNNIALVSSSFADELIGKLFLEQGPMNFMTRFKITGTTLTVKQLIDRAIAQRMSFGR